MTGSWIANPDAAARSNASNSVKAEMIELTGPRYVLPSAACYGLYWTLAGTSVGTESTFSIQGNCFRQEKSVEGLARLVAFTMREIVCIGAPSQVAAFVEKAKETVVRLAADFGVKATLVPASDPFFLHDSPRAKMERIAPVKHELVSERGVALASVNYHRNFFGSKCKITTSESGKPAYTACMAFGIERWLGELDTGLDTGPTRAGE
ncbi:MAG: aminoacyl--tRNA ligase-related protein [Trebonia sp.]